MKSMVLITASECNKCNYVKSHVDCSKVEVLDRESPEAMAIMVMYGVYDKDLHLPIFISDKYNDDAEIIAGKSLEIIERIKFYSALEKTIENNKETLEELSKC